MHGFKAQMCNLANLVVFRRNYRIIISMVLHGALWNDSKIHRKQTRKGQYKERQLKKIIYLL